MYLKWKCNICEDVVISNSKRHHEMNFCKCNQTGVDLEEEYMRVNGISFKQLEEYDYNFFDELVICMIEQGFKDGFFIIKNIFMIKMKTVWEIRELEDKIMESLK